MIKETITKNILIGDLVSAYPGSVQILGKHGMHCIGCHVATWETLEQAAESHGLDIDKLLKELKKGE
jgi:hybrid cluster-associated redox disulfide protein